VTVRLGDGSSVSTECLSARGGPDRPLPVDTWRAKLIELAQPVYPRIVAVLDEIVSGDARRRAQPWPELVREMTQAP